MILWMGRAYCCNLYTVDCESSWSFGKRSGLRSRPLPTVSADPCHAKVLKKYKCYDNFLDNSVFCKFHWDNTVIESFEGESFPCPIFKLTGINGIIISKSGGNFRFCRRRSRRFSRIKVGFSVRHQFFSLFNCLEKNSTNATSNFWKFFFFFLQLRINLNFNAIVLVYFIKFVARTVKLPPLWIGIWKLKNKMFIFSKYIHKCFTGGAGKSSRSMQGTSSPLGFFAFG